MEAPSEAPHVAAAKGAKNGLNALKKLPPWALVLIAGGVLVVVMFMRAHNASAASADTSSAGDSTGSSADTTGSDPYGNSNAGYGDPYGGGYGGGGGVDTSGGSAYEPDLPGVLGALFPNGINPPPAAAPAAPITIQFPTGGGMTKKKTGTHQPSKPRGGKDGTNHHHSKNKKTDPSKHHRKHVGP